MAQKGDRFQRNIGSGVNLPESLWGYRTVADSGEQVPSTCGTEEANEGDECPQGLPSEQTWAKRKFKAGPRGGDGDEHDKREATD